MFSGLPLLKSPRPGDERLGAPPGARLVAPPLPHLLTLLRAAAPSACSPRSLYPLLREVKLGIDPHKVFEDADWALLIGAKPRGPGMERK